VDGLERDGEAGGRAVRVGDDEPALGEGRLGARQLQVVRVDLGDEQRDVRPHAVGGGVGEHRYAGIGERGLSVLSHLGGEARERQPAPPGDGLGLQRLYSHGEGLVLEADALHPQDLPKRLPLRPLGGV